MSSATVKLFDTASGKHHRPSGFKKPATPREIMAKAGIVEKPDRPLNGHFSADGEPVGLDEPLAELPEEATYVELVSGG